MNQLTPEMILIEAERNIKELENSFPKMVGYRSLIWRGYWKRIKKRGV